MSAARLVKRFPVLYEAIASGELHLTGLLMLGPHLTLENHLDVLKRAAHRTKVELSKLVRTLDPLPDLPARIEPLRPAPARSAKANPSWGDYIAAWAPVRQLAPGAAPRDWINDELSGLVGAEEEQSAPARPGAEVATGPLRYAVQFSAQEEYVQLVERAKALLSFAHDKSSLEEIHLRAMQLLVEQLEQRRFAKTSRPRRSRYVPAEVRRAVFERDAARCTFVDATGQRCRETHGLELHHLQAFALGGAHQASNITLRCRAHNALAAEQDLGRDFVKGKQGA